MPDVMDTYVENRLFVQPNHANSLGTAHGGNVMKWMDDVGAMAAMRFAGETCVTARMDQFNFQRPIPVGDIAVLEAYVYTAGQTSVRVRLKAARENPRTRDQLTTTDSYAVYVAINEARDPVAVPDLTTSTQQGETLRKDALTGDPEER